MASTSKTTGTKPKLAPGIHRTPSSLRKEHKTLQHVRQEDSLKNAPTSYILANAKQLCSMMTMVEHKDVVPTFRGSNAPSVLATPSPGYRYEETKESKALAGTLRNLFGDKHYRFRLSTALNMSSSGAGIVNSTVSNSTLASEPDFVSLSSIFNEFFVVGFNLHWMPVSRYNYPLTGVTATSVANLPLGCADLQHGQTAYTALALMTTNFRYQHHSTGDPFTYSWKNVESSHESVVTSTTASTQSWSAVGNIANYLGSVQFLTQSAPPALPVSQLLGTFVVDWEVLFRVRV